MLLPHSKKILALGECMIELSHTHENTLKMSFAGDTLNTAVYLARYQNPTQISVFYGTAIGSDPYSTQMQRFWEDEGIETDFVQHIPNKLSGLYFIRTDQYGERTFYFYRSNSAARQFFHATSPETLEEMFLGVGSIVFSAVGLAIWDTPSRTQLFHWIEKARQQGVLICFDSNYRPSLWPDKKLAQQLTQKAWALSDIYLPTFEDHQALFQDSSPKALIDRLIHEEGIPEVAVKAGAQGCWVGNKKQIQWVPACAVQDVIDTTGAGDAFNAGYLAGRFQNLDLVEAAKKGHQLAATVVRFPGAIIPKAQMPLLFKDA